MKKVFLSYLLFLLAIPANRLSAQQPLSPYPAPEASPLSDIPTLSGQKPYGVASSSNREDRPFGIAANLGTAALIGVSADYFITPVLDLEAGVGWGQYIGVNWHPFGYNYWWNWSPYIGASGVHVQDWSIPLYVSGFGVFREPKTEHYWGGYFPLGVQLISDGGFAFNVEVAFIALQSRTDHSWLYGPWGGVRLGYHFY